MTLQELIASGGPFADDAAARAWALELEVVWVDVPWKEFLVFLHEQGIDRPTLVQERDAGATAQRKTAAQYFLDVINAGRDLSTSDSRIRALLNSSGLTNAHKTALTALAQVQRPRWQGANDLRSEPTLDDIAAVRS